MMVFDGIESIGNCVAGFLIFSVYSFFLSVRAILMFLCFLVLVFLFYSDDHLSCMAVAVIRGRKLFMRFILSV